MYLTLATASFHWKHGGLVGCVCRPELNVVRPGVSDGSDFPIASQSIKLWPRQCSLSQRTLCPMSQPQESDNPDPLKKQQDEIYKPVRPRKQFSNTTSQDSPANKRRFLKTILKLHWIARQMILYRLGQTISRKSRTNLSLSTKTKTLDIYVPTACSTA